MLVDDATVLVEELHRNATLGSRGRHGETALHVFDDLQRGSADGEHFAFGLRLRLRFGSRRRRSCWSRSSSRGRARFWSRRAVSVSGGYDCGRTIAGKLAEISAPRVVDEIGVTAKALQQGLDVGGIGAEFLGDYLG